MSDKCPIYNYKLQNIFYEFYINSEDFPSEHAYSGAIKQISMYHGAAFVHDFEYYPKTFKISKRILYDDTIDKIVLLAFIRFHSVFEDKYGASCLSFNNPPNFELMEQWYNIYMLHIEGSREITAKDFKDLYKRLTHGIGQYSHYIYNLRGDWENKYLEVTPALFAYLLRAGNDLLPRLYYELLRHRRPDGDAIFFGDQLYEVMGTTLNYEKILLNDAIITAQLHRLFMEYHDETYVFYSVEDDLSIGEAYYYLFIPLRDHPSRDWPDDTSFVGGSLREDHLRAWNEPDNP